MTVLRAGTQRRLTLSLQITRALRRTDESIYCKIVQTCVNMWQKLQHLTQSGFASTAVLPLFLLQPTYFIHIR
ncbi:hypothetical protein L9F63_018364, partial [Diploptera punctata]